MASLSAKLDFAAITHALEVTKLADKKRNGLSLVERINWIGEGSIGVTWQPGTEDAFKEIGFVERRGLDADYRGLVDPRLGDGYQGLHLEFSKSKGNLVGDKVHIDYRGAALHPFWRINGNIRAKGNYERYVQMYGPLPGYVP